MSVQILAHGFLMVGVAGFEPTASWSRIESCRNH